MTRPVTRGAYLTGPLGVDERDYVKFENHPGPSYDRVDDLRLRRHVPDGRRA